MIIMVLILIIMIIYYGLETDYKSFIKGLLGVCPGEERHLVVPAALAYGDRSCLQIVGVQLTTDNTQGNGHNSLPNQMNKWKF